MRKQGITLIKLGGSIITDKSKPYTFRPETVRRLAREIKKAGVPVIIFHGSGSFGHTSAKKYGGKKGYKNQLGIAKVSRDAMEINRLVMDILIEEKLPAVSLRPMSLILANEGKIKKNNFEVILELLSQGIIPVMYGDVIWDAKWKSTIYSGEVMLTNVAKFLLKSQIKINKAIQIGITDGIYNSEKQTMPIITEKEYKTIDNVIYKNSTVDVTGGIKHKLESAFNLSKKGIKTYIINGSRKNELSAVLRGKTSKFITLFN